MLWQTRKGKRDENGNPDRQQRGRGTKKIPSLPWSNVTVVCGRELSSMSTPATSSKRSAIRSAQSRNPYDELNLYAGIGQEFEGGHQTVTTVKEVCPGDVKRTRPSLSLLCLSAECMVHFIISPRRPSPLCDEFSSGGMSGRRQTGREQ